MAEIEACVDCNPDQQSAPPVSAEPTTTPAHSNPLDPTTFVPPSPSIFPSITIEFCDRCRWLHRATWTSTELFLTFPTPAIRAINIIPLNAEDTAGRFRVWLFLDCRLPVLVWDRKVEGGFPELKVLKQRIRDHILPGKSLGHSDK
ncbi:Rdx family-domain-containing protein [Fomes fomentarius]|nr:Rdx family-domain-containing protein [Fomes fomentarius]